VSGLKLTGDRCQCPSCEKLFNSTAAFDKHRTGSFSPLGLRRCLSAEEMLAAGMAENDAGRWVTSKWPFAASGNTETAAIDVDPLPPAA
jgi:hypothetical protein